MSLTYAPGDTATGEFPLSAATGAAVNADGTPTMRVYRNNVLTADSVTLTNPSTGRYVFSFTIPVGYAERDEVRITTQPIVGGITLPETTVFRTRLDAAVSSRLAAVAYTAPDNASIGTAATQATEAATSAASANTKATAIISTLASLPSAASIAAAVWGAATRTLSSISDSAGVTAIKVVTDKLATMIEQIGTSGLWRFVTGALSQAPTGSGGGGGAALPSAPDVDWRIEAAGELALSSQSLEFLKATVTGTIGGRLVDATGYVVEFAFLLDSADLATATWIAGEWDTQSRARLLVGPDSSVELAPGAYHWYVRLGESPVQVVRRVPGVLRVE